MNLAALPRVAPAAVPKQGSFFSLHRRNGPPLPFFRPEYVALGLPVYSLGGNRFLVDDTSLDWAAIEAERRVLQAAAAMGSGGLLLLEGAGGTSQMSSSYGPNDLWLELVAVTNDTAQLLVHTPEADAVYDLLQSPSLGTNGWAWVARGLPGQTEFSVTNLPPDGAFYILGTMAGLDTNGVTTAYRSLVGGDETLARDTDHDSLPDVWEILHFGNLDQVWDGDYDGDGSLHGTESTLGTNPNTISFEARFPAFRVRGATATGEIVVRKGVPAALAVLCDSTNFEAATWQPFEPSLCLTLGTTNGPKTFWIGLRGRSDRAGATWRAWTLIRDAAPPLLGFTNLPANPVSQPFVQLGGYSAEPLAALSYDLENTSATNRNQPGLVVRQELEENGTALGTNWWQLVDVALAPGTNTLAVRGTDLAGNCSTQTVMPVLDLAGDAVPPTARVLWPGPATRVGCSTFTLRAWTDDATATALATVTVGGEMVAEAHGIVERDGWVWVERLPVTSGTNNVSLRLTDAAGNTTLTNWYVVGTPGSLTIDSFQYLDLYQPTIPVSGKVADTKSEVWVNGVQAQVWNDGTWQAPAVPLNPGGTAVVQARAISGTPSGQGSDQPRKLDDLGNPSDASAQDAEEQTDRDPAIVQTLYFRKRMDETHGLATDSFHDTVLEDIFWAQHQPGHWSWNDCWGTTSGYYEWSRAAWDPSGNGLGLEGLTRWTNGCGGEEGYTATNYVAPTEWAKEFCCVEAYVVEDADFLSRVWSRQRTAVSTFELQTGGKKRIQRKHLYSLGADFQGICNPFWPKYVGDDDTYPISPVGINLGQLGPLGADGNLYAALPSGAKFDITPIVPGPTDYYIWTYRYPTLHRLVHETLHTALADTNRSRMSLGVGEEVNFCLDPPVMMQWPELPSWETSGGSVEPAFGSATSYTAPSNSAIATVRVLVRDVQLDTVFQVREPAGVAHASIVVTNLYGTNYIGAGAKFRVVFAPTTVSLYRVEIEEVRGPATNAWGRFTNAPFTPERLDHTSDRFVAVSPENNWVDNDACETWSLPPLDPGGYTWLIPARWRIPGDGTNAMTGWVQQVSLDSLGTMRIEKFGSWLSRSTDEVINVGP